MLNLSWKQAVIKVLEDAHEAMHYKDISEKIVALKLRKKIGATPASATSTAITLSLKKEGDKSPFQRVSSGVYMLKSDSSGTTKKKALKQKVTAPEDLEGKPSIISSFGMFWRRELVHWQRKPRLLGMEQLGANQVDFKEQVGIYLLYDGREIIYVGRTTDRSLGTRLYEHTVDRLATRWDRFSWFGLFPISEDGKLSDIKSTFDSSLITPTLEAILIEALEPRQNRRRGDDMAVEYLQKEDPEIEKRRKKLFLTELAKGYE